MKTISVADFIVVVGFSLWGPADQVSGKSEPKNLNSSYLASTSCGCLQITDLQNRLKAVNAALAALEQQQSAERWQVPFSQKSYQDDLAPLVMVAMGNARAGAMSRMAGNIDPSSCAIRPDSPPVTGCFADLLAKNLENRKENCESWKSDPNSTGNDYRATQSMSDVIGELLTSYYAEQGLIEEKLATLRPQCGNRGNANSMPPGIPPSIPPGGTVPPARTPTGTIPPSGVPIGFPPGIGPPTGGPPVFPPLPPPDNPPIIPPMPPTGTGGPTTGYVHHIFDMVLSFPVLGDFWYKANSRIPFNITQNRVTGGGTIKFEIDTSASVCTVSNFDATFDITVSGRQVGNYMDVTVTRQPSGGTGPSFADKVANIRMDCKVGEVGGFAQLIPNPMSNVTPAIRQRLPLPPVGGPPTTTIVPAPRGVPGRTVLRVYRP